MGPVGRDNYVVLARSGAGKSYFVKLDVLRNLSQGVTVAVIDPKTNMLPWQSISRNP